MIQTRMPASFGKWQKWPNQQQHTITCMNKFHFHIIFCSLFMHRSSIWNECSSKPQNSVGMSMAHVHLIWCIKTMMQKSACVCLCNKSRKFWMVHVKSSQSGWHWLLGWLKCLWCCSFKNIQTNKRGETNWQHIYSNAIMDFLFIVALFLMCFFFKFSFWRQLAMSAKFL